MRAPRQRQSSGQFWAVEKKAKKTTKKVEWQSYTWWAPGENSIRLLAHPVSAACCELSPKLNCYGDWSVSVGAQLNCEGVICLLCCCAGSSFHSSCKKICQTKWFKYFDHRRRGGNKLSIPALEILFLFQACPINKATKNVGAFDPNGGALENNRAWQHGWQNFLFSLMVHAAVSRRLYTFYFFRPFRSVCMWRAWCIIWCMCSQRQQAAAKCGFLVT